MNRRTPGRGGSSPRGGKAPPGAVAGTTFSAQFNAVVAAAERVLRFDLPADALLSDFFRAHRSGARDRALIAGTVYALLRRKRWLTRLVGDEVPAPSRLRLRVALAMVRLLGHAARQVEEALTPAECDWLRQHREPPDPEFSLAETLDLPDWLIERLAPRHAPEALLALARGLNTPAPLDLRVNAMKAERAKVLAQLGADGIEAEPCPWAPQGIRLRGHPALNKHPLFLDGSVEVQDEGSQLLGYLLQPRRGELVVDFCAGAGGKTLLLGALMRSTGRLYAFDVAETRLARMKPRLARSGLSNVHPVCITGEHDQRVKRLAGKADRVLVDAPCSGLGTLRRNPDLKWRQQPEGIVELTAKQAAILAAAARLVKPGGRLVYATCSILDEENADIVAAFLAAHPEFRRLSAQAVLAAQGIAVECGEEMRLLPHVHGTDGFYAAVLERAS